MVTPMELVLDRIDRNAKRTIGTLAINGVFFCYTLEDGDTRIPAGTYKLAWHESPRFKRRLPILQNVPGRSYILIHAGNTDADTEGCILVGFDRAKDSILQSRLALEALLHRLELPAFLTAHDVASPNATPHQS